MACIHVVCYIHAAKVVTPSVHFNGYKVHMRIAKRTPEEPSADVVYLEALILLHIMSYSAFSKVTWLDNIFEWKHQ